MKKVSLKVAAKLPELATEFTSAFKEVIQNYGDETVAVFSTVCKKAKGINKVVLEVLSGDANVATGLVTFIIENEGSFINRKPQIIWDSLKEIEEAFSSIGTVESQSEDNTITLPNVTDCWLTIAANITIIPPEQIVSTDVELDEDAVVVKEDKPGVDVETMVNKQEHDVLTKEQEKALDKAADDFADGIKNISKEFEDMAKDITKDAMEKKSNESTLVTDILTGAAVVAGVLVVGTGLYYVGKAIFGSEEKDVFI